MILSNLIKLPFTWENSVFKDQSNDWFEMVWNTDDISLRNDFANFLRVAADHEYQRQYAPLKWKKVNEEFAGHVYKYACTGCNTLSDCSYKYCQHCGSKMDGVEE
jgi:hypothetical protein